MVLELCVLWEGKEDPSTFVVQYSHASGPGANKKLGFCLGIQV